MGTIEQCKAYAERRGGRCLSKEYLGALKNLWWQCEYKHNPWPATPAHVMVDGSWCHTCGGCKRDTIENMRAIAKSRGGECLSTEYVNQSTELRWRCAKGHEWNRIPALIKDNKKQKGSWCPKCRKHRILTIDDMHELAAQFGGECLSKAYKNNSTPLRWRCKEGHIFERSSANIKNYERWCSHCRRLGKRLN